MKYAYPAIFHEEDGKILASVPDLPYINTFGNDVPDALYMAQDAIEMWLWDAENNSDPIPPPSGLDEIANSCEPGQFVSLVAADTDAYRRQYDTRAIKKTLSVPAWLNHQAEQANAPFSQILQQGLKEYLGIAA